MRAIRMLEWGTYQADGCEPEDVSHGLEYLRKQSLSVCPELIPTFAALLRDWSWESLDTGLRLDLIAEALLDDEHSELVFSNGWQAEAFYNDTRLRGKRTEDGYRLELTDKDGASRWFSHQYGSGEWDSGRGESLDMTCYRDEWDDRLFTLTEWMERFFPAWDPVIIPDSLSIKEQAEVERFFNYIETIRSMASGIGGDKLVKSLWRIELLLAEAIDHPAFWVLFRCWEESDRYGGGREAEVDYQGRHYQFSGYYDQATITLTEDGETHTFTYNGPVTGGSGRWTRHLGGKYQKDVEQTEISYDDPIFSQFLHDWLHGEWKPTWAQTQYGADFHDKQGILRPRPRTEE